MKMQPKSDADKKRLKNEIHHEPDPERRGELIGEYIIKYLDYEPTADDEAEKQSR